MPGKVEIVSQMKGFERASQVASPKRKKFADVLENWRWVGGSGNGKWKVAEATTIYFQSLFVTNLSDRKSSSINKQTMPPNGVFQ